MPWKDLSEVALFAITRLYRSRDGGRSRWGKLGIGKEKEGQTRKEKEDMNKDEEVEGRNASERA